MSLSETVQESDVIWEEVCDESALVPNSGICALINGVQVAIFTFVSFSGETTLYACDNYEPIGKANVLSRGLICHLGGEVSICSPLYKQHYSLVDGRCFENADVSINVYPVKLVDGKVYVSVTK